MKKKIKVYFSQLIIIGLLLTLANSCKKLNELIVKKDPVITWSNPADIAYGTLLSATQLNATADVAGIFVYSPSIDTKLNVGLSQDLNVIFTPTDSVNYNTVSKNVKINVNAKKDPVITWSNPADIAYGTLLSATQLNATADVAGTFVYSPSIDALLNVGTNQDLNVTFTPTDIVNYNSVTKNVKINVVADAAGTVTDIDGNVYHIITIGTQTWMLENLKTTKYNDGTAIANVTDANAWVALTTGAYANYDNTATNSTTYGKLYNYYAVIDSRKICPTGWHVPTDTEWTALATYLGGISVAGGKLKETGTTHWFYPNTGADNTSGFTALSGGYRSGTGSYNSIRYYGYFWSSTVYTSTSAYARHLFYNAINVERFADYKTNGLSVRCIKD